MMNDPILVTGVAGFIGSHLVKRLVSQGKSVVALVKKTTDLSRLNSVRDAISFLYADLLDAKAMKEMIQNVRPAGVFHLAASNIASGVTAGDDDVVRVNLLGTKNLMDALIGSECRFFINTGSFMEYGPKDHPVREDDICEPTELYSITKLGATLYGQAMARQHRLPIVTLRLFTPYGPDMQAGRLVYEVVRRAKRGEEISVSDASVTRDFIYIDDILDIFLLISEKADAYRGHIFNCGSGQTVSIGDFVRLALRLTNSSSLVHWNSRPALAYDALLWQADMTKTREIAGWKPHVSLEKGLLNMIEWIE